MNLLGIIAEYNPFHYGHQYQLEQGKALSQRDGTVIVMSGFFCQRGIPALIHPWARAKSAILGGGDLVLLLPTVFSLNNADAFAYGGVSLLNNLPGLNTLSFGSENDNIADLQKLAFAILYDKELNLQAQNLQNQGGNYGRNLFLALSSHDSYAPLARSLEKPNNILAISYLKSLLALDSKIKPTTILRKGASYLDENLQSYASATAIRKAISENRETKDYLPDFSYEILQEEKNQGRLHTTPENFAVQILSQLQRQSPSLLSQLPEMNEGLEHRFWANRYARSLDTLIKAVKSKRHPYSKLQRILFQLLLGLNKEDIRDLSEPVPYALILAMNSKGREILSFWRKNCSLPIIDKPYKQIADLNSYGQRLLNLDLLAAQLWTIALPNLRARESFNPQSQLPLRLF